MRAAKSPRCQKVGAGASRVAPAELQGLLESMADMVFVFDSDRRFVYCNAAQDDTRLLTAPDAFIGKRHDEVLPPHVNTLFSDAFEKVQHGETRSFEYALQMAETTRWFRATVSARRLNGTFAGAVALVRDITEYRALEKCVVGASEAARRQLVFNLHDDLGQHLVGLQMVADSLCHELAREYPAGLPRVEELRQLARDALQKTRELVHGFSSLESGPEGLALGLRRLAGDVDRRSERITVRFDVGGDVRVDNVETATQLYRIAEEAVTNAVRHASPTHIVVRLTRDADSIRLDVADDGCGIADGSGTGMGMRIMQFRANMIGGEFRVDSEPGRGTRITCTCPRSACSAPPDDPT